MAFAKANLNHPHWTRRLKLALIILSFLAVFWVEGAALFDRYAVCEDIRSFYWMARFQDPTLFANDPLSSGFVTDLNVLGHTVVVYFRSVGYSLLFYLLSFAIDPLWVSKLLVFVLLPVSAMYAFGLGRMLRDNLTGLLLALLYLFSILSASTAIALTTGLQRSFTVPLLAASIYYLIKTRYWAAAGVMVLGGLFYLPVLPIVALTYALSFVEINRSAKHPAAGSAWHKLPRRLGLFDVKITWRLSRRKVVPFVIGLAVSMALVAPAFLKETDVRASIAASSSEQVRILENPMYLEGGRAELFSFFPFLGRAGILGQKLDVLNNLVLLVTVILIWITLGSRSLRLNLVVWYLLLSGLVLALASAVTIFVFSSFMLYYPSRFTRGTIFLFALCFIAWNLPDLVRSATPFLRRNAGRLIRYLMQFVLVALIVSEVCIIIVPLLFPASRSTRSVAGVSVHILAPVLGGAAVLLAVILVRRLRYLDGREMGSSTEKQERIARAFLLVASATSIVLAALYVRLLGPWLMNPTADERALYQFLGTLPKDTLLAGEPEVMSNVPLFAERSVLFSAEEVGRDDRAILDFFCAYYAETGHTVHEFCRQYGVDYLVISQESFAREYLAKGRLFFEPYNDDILAAVSRRSDFVLSNVPEEATVFRSGPLSVARCDTSLLAAGTD